jgi:hypothetical protein
MTELSIVERPEPPKSTKPFTATYSKIKNFETCARRYHEVDVLKLYDMDTTELDKGNRLHKAMADRVMKGTPLPIDIAYMERWAKILTVVIDPQQTIQCELKLAFSRNHQGVAYYDKRVWMRVVIDYLNMVPDTDGYFVHVVDYKTGKPKDDDTQLMINAAAVFANYPLVSKIRTTFIWTEYNDTRHMIVDREDIRELWPDITIRADALEVAHLTDTWPPKKCGLCRDYCPVRECEFNGKR